MEGLKSQIDGIANSLQNLAQMIDQLIAQASPFEPAQQNNDNIENIEKELEDYKAIISGNESKEFKEEKIKETKENFVKSLFNESNEEEEEEEESKNEEENIGKKKLMLKNKVSSIPQNNFDGIIPSISLNVDKAPQDINYEKLPSAFDDDVSILDIDFSKQTSTIIKIAILSSICLDHDQMVQKNEDYVKKLQSSIDNVAIIGNIIDEPVITYPSDSNVQNAINKKSMNQFQYKIDLTEEEIKEILEKIVKKLRSNKGNENWKYVFKNKQLYDDLEKQVLIDLENNPYELIITGQTVITSIHIDEYNEIKKIITAEKAKECFLYHGSQIENHPKIAKTHFLMPGQDDMNKTKITDKGFFGQGIYSTDNIFYASLYGNKSRFLKINQSTSILSCKSIYNKEKVKDLFEIVNDFRELSTYGQPIADDIKDNYGVNHALVGSANRFLPISIEEIDKSAIAANEYVFPHKYQFIPCISFRVTRTDHYILWKDEKISNNENSRYLNELKKRKEINVYSKDNIEDALNLIKKKKFAALKLITNSVDAQHLITKARDIIGSKFVCLVFGNVEDSLEWITKMENVLFTNEPKFFREFADLNMDIKELLAFVKKLENENNCTFKLNEEELLKFPNCKDPYYQKYYEHYEKNKVIAFIKGIASFFW